MDLHFHYVLIVKLCVWGGGGAPDLYSLNMMTTIVNSYPLSLIVPFVTFVLVKITTRRHSKRGSAQNPNHDNSYATAITKILPLDWITVSWVEAILLSTHKLFRHLC